MKNKSEIPVIDKDITSQIDRLNLHQLINVLHYTSEKINSGSIDSILKGHLDEIDLDGLIDILHYTAEKIPEERRMNSFRRILLT